jgi:hypothetical protein
MKREGRKKEGRKEGEKRRRKRKKKKYAYAKPHHHLCSPGSKNKRPQEPKSWWIFFTFDRLRPKSGGIPHPYPHAQC